MICRKPSIKCSLSWDETRPSGLQAALNIMDLFDPWSFTGRSYATRHVFNAHSLAYTLFATCLSEASKYHLTIGIF